MCSIIASLYVENIAMDDSRKAPCLEASVVHGAVVSERDRDSALNLVDRGKHLQYFWMLYQNADRGKCSC